MSTTQRAKFDFEAFIAGAQLPRRTVSFYAIDNTDEINQLTAEHDSLPPEADDRVSSKSPRRRIAEKIKALREEMEASEQRLVIRALDPNEFRDQGADDSIDIFDQLAKQSVEPVLTADQWRAIAQRMSAGAWGSQVVAKANALVLGSVAVPDFSQSVLESLSPQESSQS